MGALTRSVELVRLDSRNTVCADRGGLTGGGKLLEFYN